MKSFWSDQKGPIAIAHRGGASYGKDKYRTENTLAAFEASVKMGYIYLEIDVIATLDDQVIVIHVAKNKFEAWLGKKEAPDYERLQKMTYLEIKAWLGRDIPTLEEVLKRFPANKFFTDTKTDEVVEPLVQVITKLKAEGRLCLGSFYPMRLIKLHRLLGNGVPIRLLISRSPVHLLRQCKYLSDSRSNNILEAVDLPYIHASRYVIAKFHKKGLKVLVWTPNTSKKLARAVRLGADGIISDNATLLKEVLENR